MTEVTYNDTDALRAALVGRKIIETRHGEGKRNEYSDPMPAISFVLDDGTILEAIATDGGCACSNGCWSVENPESAPSQVITNVEVIDEPDTEGFGDSATLRMFVYADNVKTELVRSVGMDNGYYGWGYAVAVKAPEVSA